VYNGEFKFKVPDNNVLIFLNRYAIKSHKLAVPALPNQPNYYKIAPSNAGSDWHSREVPPRADENANSIAYHLPILAHRPFRIHRLHALVL